MADAQLINYVHQSIGLGYTEEDIRKTLISAGYDMRNIDDAIDAVLRPQDLTPIEPALPQKKSFFDKVPVWIFLVAGGGVFLIVLLTVLFWPSSGGAGAESLLSQNGISVSTYDFACAGPASTLTITVTNAGTADLADLQLFKDDAFQAGALISALAVGASDTYTLSNLNCNDWLGDRKVKVTASSAEAEGTLKFTCSSGAC